MWLQGVWGAGTVLWAVGGSFSSSAIEAVASLPTLLFKEVNYFHTLGDLSGCLELKLYHC